MKTITAQMLLENDACTEEVNLFVETFGESATLTRANLTKAIKAGLEVNWLARLLLAASRSDYNKVSAVAQSEYNKANAAAWAEYCKVGSVALLIALRSTP